jgi:DNA mismatch repair protein MutH
LGVEIKVLPVTLNNRNGLKAKEPTQIKMINFMKVAEETRETTELRDKIDIVFWIVYGVEKKNGKNPPQDEYIILDYFLDHPTEPTMNIFKKDRELIQSYIIK